jgi:hypothetical protein
VSTLLRVVGLVALAWAVLAFFFKDQLVGAAALSPGARALIKALSIANAVLACMFWNAAGNPVGNRGTIYCAITFTALKTANDLYDLLVLLPANRALISLGDLVVSVALLVGILEALPRTLAAKH